MKNNKWKDTEGEDVDAPSHATILRDFTGIVKIVRKTGKGYSGGHNTATMKGWRTDYPEPPDRAIAWWDDTREGRFTGYFPAIIVVMPVQEQTTEES